jgi:hypothetical protein
VAAGRRILRYLSKLGTAAFLRARGRRCGLCRAPHSGCSAEQRVLPQCVCRSVSAASISGPASGPRLGRFQLLEVFFGLVGCFFSGARLPHMTRC